MNASKRICFVVFTADEKNGVFADRTEAQKLVDKINNRFQFTNSHINSFSLTRAEMENVYEDDMSDEEWEKHGTV